MNPRFRLNKNGTGTISGVDFNDLESILTAARLHRHDHPFKPWTTAFPVLESTVQFNKRVEEWHRRQWWILNRLDEARLKAIRATFPPGKEPSLKERLRKSTNERRSIKNLEREFVWDGGN